MSRFAALFRVTGQSSESLNPERRMTATFRLPIVALALIAASAPLAAQRGHEPAVTVSGAGVDTWVLLSGMVGGVAGFRRLETRLLERGARVIIIDPYHLSLDSSDVSFAAMAGRVEIVLDQLGVTDARIVGHAHGAGVMVRLAARAPHLVSHLYFLDVGGLSRNRTEALSSSVRLLPLIARMPGGRGFIRDRLVRALRENSGRDDWLDAATRRAYTEPMLDGIDRVARLAVRLHRAEEPEPLEVVISRLDVPVLVVLGEVPHASQPDSAELATLAPLGARLRITRLAGVGHFPHEEAPDDLVLLLMATQSMRQVAAMP